MNFATSAVEEFMIAKREREEYKALAKPALEIQSVLICLANVGLKGCLHWILGPEGTIKLLLQWPIFESNLS